MSALSSRGWNRGRSAKPEEDLERVCWLQTPTPDNMQIFEGTNQIQRLVIRRHLAS
jgi:hypothetical protein